jgi:hypothetical protein
MIDYQTFSQIKQYQQDGLKAGYYFECPFMYYPFMYYPFMY